MGFAGRRNVYGDRLALLVQIEVTYADGRREIVGSDGSWKSATGPILMSEIYHGETYDARLEKPGWDRSGLRRARTGAESSSPTTARTR